MQAAKRHQESTRLSPEYLYLSHGNFSSVDKSGFERVSISDLSHGGNAHGNGMGFFKSCTLCARCAPMFRRSDGAMWVHKAVDKKWVLCNFCMVHTSSSASTDGRPVGDNVRLDVLLQHQDQNFQCALSKIYHAHTACDARLNALFVVQQPHFHHDEVEKC